MSHWVNIIKSNLLIKVFSPSSHCISLDFTVKIRQSIAAFIVSGNNFGDNEWREKWNFFHSICFKRKGESRQFQASTQESLQMCHMEISTVYFFCNIFFLLSRFSLSLHSFIHLLACSFFLKRFDFLFLIFWYELAPVCVFAV